MSDVIWAIVGAMVLLTLIALCSHGVSLHVNDQTTVIRLEWVQK